MSDCDHDILAQHERSYKPKVKLEQRVERRSKTMVTNQPASSEITDFRSVKRIVGPAGWAVVDASSTGLGTRHIKYFHPPDMPDVQINLYFRGMPIDDDSAQIFAKLLKEAPRALTVDEIKALHMVMGFNHAGNNQYTNDAPKGTRDYHVFSMKSAEIAVLNGRNVLKLSGSFQNDKGIPTMEYEGFLFPNKHNITEIEELFYQAPTRGKLMRHQNSYEQALKTIEWN